MIGNLPLSGVRVFELGGNVAGPYATWILAELGAEVTKVERPEGDDCRGWGPPFWQGQSTLFQAINRNKDSSVYDLKSDAAAERLRADLIEKADVVLQSLRPGTVERFGLDAARLTAENPRLIYCNLRAFGATGPLKDRPGYDALIQAFGGIMSVTGEEGRPPVRAGISAIDMGTGLWCAIGILAAIVRRHLTGRGGVVDASLFETALAWMSFYSADYQTTGDIPVRHGSGVRGIVPYQAFECSDGYLIVAASNDRLFVKLADALGHPEWSNDPRFRDNASRSANRDELVGLIGGILGPETRAHWQEILDAAGVPCAPTQSIDEVLAHPQTEALGIAQQATADGFKLIGLPLSFDGERPPLRHLAPKLDAANDDAA